MLQNFEDNAAVIKMILRKKSDEETCVWYPQIAFHELLDRIIVDPTIHIKYVDSKTQLCRHVDERQIHS